MPIIKVWCLPLVNEMYLNKLHRKIVGAVVGIEELGLKNENDMTCLFPADMMKKGLGEEIIIEVTNLFETPERTSGVRNRLAMTLANVVYEMFPEAFIECSVEPPNPAGKYCTRGAIKRSSLILPKK